MPSVIHVLAYYCLTPVDKPEEEVLRQKEFLSSKGATGRIYISHQGINGQMSIASEESGSYIEWMHQDPRFRGVDFKIHEYHEHVFPRLSIKVRRQLVAMDEEVDFSLRGEAVTPKRWKEMLEERDEDTLLLDVRNEYEWDVGHFSGAELPELTTFREFPSYARKLKEEKDPAKTKVMMYCTGGIRCELFSAFLKKEGFEQVFQLEGGVVKYGLEEGAAHWKGKLFVFDDRLTVPVSPSEEAPSIGTCRHCGVSGDVYYNCASMECNELFVSCSPCAETLLGCCSEECRAAPRLRPYDKSERPKPFKRWYHYASDG